MTELKNGMKPTELAQSLGVVPSFISDRVSEFRSELLFANGQFPPPDEETLDALADSIARDGVLVPIIVAEDGEILDGRARHAIAKGLGIECPREIHQGLTAAEKRALSIALNVARRHLTTREKRMLVTAELMRDGDRSDREIARCCGVTHPTVGKIRDQLRADGVAFEDAQAGPEDEALVEKLSRVATEKQLGLATCPCCSAALVGFIRAGSGFVLEPSS